MTCSLRVAGFVNESITDGAGIRLVIFTQGCTHNCKGCHNPHTHALDGGHLVDVDEIISRARQNPILSGITVSGGEPFLQTEAVAYLCAEVKKLGLEVAVYTGFSWEELQNIIGADKVLINTDILVDGRFVLDQKTFDLKFRGSKNQRVINVQSSLSKNELVLDVSDRWN